MCGPTAPARGTPRQAAVMLGVGSLLTVRGRVLLTGQVLSSVSANNLKKCFILLLNQFGPGTPNSTRKLTNTWNILFPFVIIFLFLISDDTQHYFQVSNMVIRHLFFIKILFIYVLERGREGEREGEKLTVWLPLTHWAPGPQPRHVP